jgi:hypothetical protein
MRPCRTRTWSYIFPPSNRICQVTITDPSQTRPKTPVKTTSLCLLEAVIDKRRLKSNENANGPLSRLVTLTSRIIWLGVYQRSQSRNPSLIAPWRRTSASGSLPARPRSPLARISPSPLSKPPRPPSLWSMPPRRYFGHSTNRNFSQDAFKSLERVSHTDSSIVFVGARRSSPCIDELR